MQKATSALAAFVNLTTFTLADAFGFGLAEAFGGFDPPDPLQEDEGGSGEGVSGTTLTS